MPLVGRPASPRPRTLRWTAAALAVGLGAPFAAAQSAPTPSGRAAVRETIRLTHPYDPAIRQRALEEAEADPDVVQMNRVVVSESTQASVLQQWLAARARAATERRPTLITGGAIERTLAGTKAELGMLRYEDLLADDARFRPDGPDVARWDLFRWKR